MLNYGYYLDSFMLWDLLSGKAWFLKYMNYRDLESDQIYWLLHLLIFVYNIGIIQRPSVGFEDFKMYIILTILIFYWQYHIAWY